MRILRDYNQYVMRNLARGYSRKDLGVSYVKARELPFRNLSASPPKGVDWWACCALIFFLDFISGEAAEGEDGNKQVAPEGEGASGEGGQEGSYKLSPSKFLEKKGKEKQRLINLKGDSIPFLVISIHPHMNPGRERERE